MVEDLIRDLKSKLSIDTDKDDEQVKMTEESKKIQIVVDDPLMKVQQKRKASDDFDLAQSQGRKRNNTFLNEVRNNNFIDLIESKTKDLAIDLGLMDDQLPQMN